MVRTVPSAFSVASRGRYEAKAVAVSVLFSRSVAAAPCRKSVEREEWALTVFVFRPSCVSMASLPNEKPLFSTSP